MSIGLCWSLAIMRFNNKAFLTTAITKSLSCLLILSIMSLHIFAGTVTTTRYNIRKMLSIPAGSAFGKSSPHP